MNLIKIVNDFLFYHLGTSPEPVCMYFIIKNYYYVERINLLCCAGEEDECNSFTDLY